MAVVVLPTPLQARAGGAESGTVFGSVDAGASWFLATEHRPKITSVQAL